MKKHFLLIFLSVILLSLCACAASACFFPKNESKWVKSMDVTVNSEHYSEAKAAFIYTYGDNIEFKKSDFTVTLNYSDDTFQTTDGYTLHTSFSSGEQVNTGTQWVYISYEHGSKTLSESYKILIEPAVGVIDVCDDVTVNYTGEDIDLLAAVNAKLKAEGKKTLSEQADAGIIGIKWLHCSQNEKAVGDYEVRVYPTQNYTFENVDIRITITKAVIAAPTIKNSEIIYDGNAHAPEFVFAPDTEKFITLQNKTSWAVAVDKEYTMAGVYTYEATPKDEMIEFEDGKTSVTLTMTILPAPLTCLESDFNILRTEYVYKGDKQYYTVDEIENTVDTDIFSLSLSPAKVSDTGDYKLIATPKGSYLYADGKPITTLSFPFKITPLQVDYSARYDEIAQELVIETTYTPDTKVSDFLDTYIKNNTKFKPEVLKALTGNSLGSCSLSKIESDDLLTAGTARYFIGYKPNSSNYEFSPVPVTLVVAKAELTAGCTFTASDNKPFVYDGNAHFYNASVTGKNVKACTLDCSLYRDGVLVESAVDAGNYKLKAEITLIPEYDKNYYLTVEDATEYEWQIDRQRLYLLDSDFDWTNANTMFEPSEKVQFGVTLKNHTSIVAIDDITLLRNNNEVDGVLDYGTYKACVSIKVKDGNYNLVNPEVTRTWEVLSTEVDLSGLNWSFPQNSVFTYGDNIKPTLVNVPGYIGVSYRRSIGGNTSGVLNAGNYYIYADCEIKNIPNADRAHIVASPSPIAFKVNKVVLTENDFKVVYRIKYEQGFNGNYTDYSDYDEEKKVTFRYVIDWYMFEVAGKQGVPEFDVVYSIVSTDSQLVSALSTGIQHRGVGKVTFTATITLKSTMNYCFENEYEPLQLTCTVEVLR